MADDLLAYRVEQMEKWRMTVAERLDSLATREDVDAIKAQLRKAAVDASHDATAKNERWYNTLVISLVSPIITGIIIAIVLKASGVVH